MLFDTHRYTLLSSPGDSEKISDITLKRPPKKVWSSKLVLVMMILSTIWGLSVGLLTGMTVGLYATIPQGETDFLIPAGPIHQETTTYNQTFTQPGPAADSAWESMFPRGLGFVKHPTIAPNHSVLAVFHQLHCMNLLRIGFYAAVNGTLEEMQMQHMQDINQRPDPKHISHCFDYLRQALMCAVDTNLEAVDPVLGGSKGYGYARTCRDFDAVKAWSDEWAYWKNFTISA